MTLFMLKHYAARVAACFVLAASATTACQVEDDAAESQLALLGGGVGCERDAEFGSPVVRLSAPAPTKIAVIGDIHSRVERLDAAIRYYQGVGANLLIGMGDYTDYGERDELKDVLGRLQRGLNLDRSQVALVPGNMEAHFIDSYDLIPLLERYGQVAVEASEEPGYVIVNDSMKLMVSHNPQSTVIGRLFPYSARFDVQRSMAKEHIPVVDLILYADTHRGGSWVDPRTGVRLANVGTLSNRKYPEEPYAFGLIDVEARTLTRIDIDHETLEVFPIP